MIRMSVTFLLLGAFPAAALPWDCAFTVTCEVGNACEAEARNLVVIAADHGGDLFLTGDIEDTPLIWLTIPDTFPASYVAVSTGEHAHLLSIQEDQTAVLSIHPSDGTAQAVTHFGSCEVLQ